MRFYKLEGVIPEKTLETEWKDRQKYRERALLFRQKSDNYCAKLEERGRLFISDADADNGTVRIGVIDNGLPDAEKEVRTFCDYLDLQLTNTLYEEITFKEINRLLRNADRNACIDDDDELKEQFGLDAYDHIRYPVFDENLIPDSEKEEVYRKAEQYLVRDAAWQELDRIYAGTNKRRVTGHPVHYLVKTDDKEIRKETCRMLLKALLSAGRIRNRRYCYADIDLQEDISETRIDALYKVNSGGAVVLRFGHPLGETAGYASQEVSNITKICKYMRDYRNQVLTILCFPRECGRMKDLFYEGLADMTFVEIEEELAEGERAEAYLKMLAKQHGVRPDRELFKVQEEGKGYFGSELKRTFDVWYSRKLKTKLYPQYRELQEVKHELKDTGPKGTACDELMNMIGLREAKKNILQALAYCKAQKIFASKGMQDRKPSMHMVFTGNPGSAKTTVARLFAQIMRENGLLSSGHLVEVGRSDLVGQYVGSTAPLVVERFKQAEGGVLFIDEAYSLLDDKSGLYGDEAINTIVQQMENRRDSVVVIFAGYPDQMEQFLQRNPGLRSRIAYHVPFKDYDAAELSAIADLMAKKDGLELTEGAKAKLQRLFESACTEADFGNGRYVRNILEKARMAQAVRLLKMDPDEVTAQDVRTIEDSDIEEPKPEKEKVERIRIGFSAA